MLQQGFDHMAVNNGLQHSCKRAAEEPYQMHLQHLQHARSCD
jgi:hypothetical protein